MESERRGHGQGRQGRLVAAVFLNGEYTDAAFDRRLAAECDLLVAADGGAARLAALGLRPHAVVGDMDSLAERAQARLRRSGTLFVTYPVRKDRTDGELAAEHALSRGATAILLAGATGPQLDHVLGHVALLRALEGRGVEASALGPRCWARAVCGPARLTLKGPLRGCRFSFVVLTADARLSLTGFEYELDDCSVGADSCLGLGNTVVAERACVVVHDGTVLLAVIADGLSVVAERASGTA